MDTAHDSTAMRRAKRPRSVIAGPYGHPFHSLLVAIPIGAWSAAIVFDIIALVGGDTAFAMGAAWLLVIGLAGAVLAIATGLLDFSTLTPGTRARRMALTHLFLNLAVTVLMVASVLVRFTRDDAGANVAGFVLALVGMGLLGFSGFLGGELVFRHGVRVADEADQVAGHTVHGR